MKRKHIKILSAVLCLPFLLQACAKNPAPPDEGDPPVPIDEPELLYPILPDENYSLWGPDGEAIYTIIRRLEGVESSAIYDTVKEAGDKYFVHGLAIEEYKGDLVATWAFNKNAENTPGEQCFGKWSYDGGKTWTDFFEIKPNDPDYSASHGVLFSHEDTLYCMLPVVKFTQNPWAVKCELFVYNPETKGWDYQVDCAFGFWPNSRPQKMDDGNWLVAGAGDGRSRYAVTEGDDFTRWRVKQIGMPRIGGRALLFNETAAIINQNMIVLVMRNDNEAEPDAVGKLEKRMRAAYAVSYDYGETFSEAALSNLYASPAKMFGGVLSDGRPYLIFNQSMEYNDARRRLILGVGEPGETAISRLYILAEYNGAIAYPYAIELDGKLYVAYSQSIASRSNGNQNNAVLAVVPIESIK